MEIEWQVAATAEWEADAIVFFAFENEEEPLPGFARWKEQNGTWLESITGPGDFEGKAGQVAVYYGPRDARVPRLVRTGLGPRDKFGADEWRDAAAKAVARTRELKVERAALALAAVESIGLEPVEALEEAVTGALLALHRYRGLKTRDTEPDEHPQKLLLLTESEPEQALRDAVEAAQAVAAGVGLARDLTATPANRARPADLAEAARQLAARHGFRLEVLDLEAASGLGMGAFAAVASGSGEPAYFVAIEHVPEGKEDDPPLVLVGKGITFDSGGISIKPSNNMALMKRDMAGAGAVLGAFEAIGRHPVERRVVGLLPLTENMPGAKAYKPSDVIDTLSGLTVEVTNTDAEGRMVLCDALAYALRYQPAGILDIATLTGACVVAVGDRVGAVMGNREELVQALHELSLAVGERVWPLPLWDFYFEELKSEVADFKNVGERKAGTIVAGTFLKQFVPDAVPWLHLDIAGPAWTDSDRPTTPKGATGFGVRLLYEAIRRWDKLHPAG